VPAYCWGPPATSQTQRVRMNLSPGSLARLLVCHSRRAGFSDVWPTIGLRTIASLKWSTTAAVAKAPPSRSYILESVIVASWAARTGRRDYAEQPSSDFAVAKSRSRSSQVGKGGTTMGSQGGRDGQSRRLCLGWCE